MGAPVLPSAKEWDRLGVRPTRELDAGHQSHVFEADVGGRRCAVKLTDARYADARSLTARTRVVEELSGVDRAVLAPISIGGEFVSRVGGWFVTATPFVVGRSPDDGSRADAEQMGAASAQLHAAMATVPSTDLPLVGAFRTIAGASTSAGDHQLLHGDLSGANMLLTDDGIRFFDFDECGHGPVAFDVANAVYMVMFDAEVNGGDARRYETFRSAFTSAYCERAGRSFDDGEIDRLIAVRIAALAHWLDDLSTAPIGIRTSSPEWHATLRSFVARHTRT